MDEDLDPDDENVNVVLAQESSQLFQILSIQSPHVIMKLCQMMPGGATWSVDARLEAPPRSSAAGIRDVLDYFSTAEAADCRNFLQSMCILCENIPMRLESRLMSVAGYANSEYEMKIQMLTVLRASVCVEGGLCMQELYHTAANSAFKIKCCLPGR